MVNTHLTSIFGLTSLLCLVTKWVKNTACPTVSLGLTFKSHSKVKVVTMMHMWEIKLLGRYC